MNNQKPKHFLVLKIVGIIGILLLIVGIVLSIIGFGDFESNNFLIGTILSPIGLMLGAAGIATGFAPEIAKMKTKSIHYIQNENKEELSDIAQNTAEITSGAVTTTTRAVMEGTRNTIFCKHCGAKIDSDSKFCSSCGKEQ